MARGPKAIAIHLSEDERAELERIIRRRSAGQALVQRARIVLACGPSQVQRMRAWHVLTDGGSCFTADAVEEACRKLKVQHRRTKPYTPQTNGLVERFNGRVQREVVEG